MWVLRAALGVHRRFRRHRVAYALVHFLLIAWLLLVPLFFVFVTSFTSDPPPPAPCRVGGEYVAEWIRSINTDTNAMVLAIDPRVDCAVSVVPFGGTETVQGFRISGTDESIHVTGNRLNVTAEPTRVDGPDQVDPSVAYREKERSEWSTPVVWPVLWDRHEAVIYRPIRFTAGDRSIVVVNGYHVSDTGINPLAPLVGLFVAGNAVLRVGQWLRAVLSS